MWHTYVTLQLVGLFSVFGLERLWHQAVQIALRFLLTLLLVLKLKTEAALHPEKQTELI